MSLFGAVMLCVLFAMASASTDTDGPRHFEISKAPELFAAFMSNYHRTYENEEDMAKHYIAFVENLKNINRQNILYPETLFGINKFADYTEEEKNQLKGFKIPTNRHN